METLDKEHISTYLSDKKTIADKLLLSWKTIDTNLEDDPNDALEAADNELLKVIEIDTEFDTRFGKEAVVAAIAAAKAGEMGDDIKSAHEELKTTLETALRILNSLKSKVLVRKDDIGKQLSLMRDKHLGHASRHGAFDEMG